MEHNKKLSYMMRTKYLGILTIMIDILNGVTPTRKTVDIGSSTHEMKKAIY